MNMNHKQTKTLFSGVCFFFNSTLNPILYSVMSLRFRRGFRDMKRSVFQRIFQLSTSQQSEGSGSKYVYSPRPRKRWGCLSSWLIIRQGLRCLGTGYRETNVSRSCSSKILYRFIYLSTVTMWKEIFKTNAILHCCKMFPNCLTDNCN